MLQCIFNLPSRSFNVLLDLIRIYRLDSLAYHVSYLLAIVTDNENLVHTPLLR